MEDSTTPAYESEELGLTDTEINEAKHAQAVAGQPPANVIIEAMRRHGQQDDAYLKSALGLPLEDYRRVEEFHKSLPRVKRMRLR
jgi:hypothetical protein